jgi:pimeloyl-ACP methyl ester carboxylesterase
MRQIEHGGISLCTETFGNSEGPAILLVMGATASMLGWPDELCNVLAEKGLFVIRFDHRDTGQSTTVPRGKATYTVEDMAGDVAGIAEAYGLRRVHLAGMSLGGYISQMVALDYPECIASLTLIASEPLGWDGEALPHISQVFLDHFRGLESLDWSNRAAVTAFLVESQRLCAGTGVPFDQLRVEAGLERVLSRTDSPASMFNHGGLTVREDWTGRFREIACPVLIIHGEEDPILPVQNGRALAAGIPGAWLVTLPGVGHELPFPKIAEMAEQIAAHVLQS